VGKIATRQVSVQRVRLISSRRFEDVVAALEGAVGHADVGAFAKKIGAAKNYAEVEKIVKGVIAPSGFMEFARYDLGTVLRKDRGDKAPRSVRFVVGNPLIMKSMLEHVPDAGSYAPVTILVDERADGVHLTYDKMASYLAPYRNAHAMKVAQDLDAKVEALLKKVAG
jgi:uncharacterized protein (DUF302 family)